MGGQTPTEGPYSNFIEDGVLVQCNPTTGFSLRYSCAFKCTDLRQSAKQLACSSCTHPVAYIESLGKNCDDLKTRYGNGLDVENPWYAAFWDNLANTCKTQLSCSCVPAYQVQQIVTYTGPVEVIDTVDYDINYLKKRYGSGREFETYD